MGVSESRMERVKNPVLKLLLHFTTVCLIHAECMGEIVTAGTDALVCVIAERLELSGAIQRVIEGGAGFI